MIPVRIEEINGIKYLIIQNQYLVAKGAKTWGGRKGYLRWLNALLRKNGFWRPLAVDGQRLQRYAEVFSTAPEYEDAYVVQQKTSIERWKEYS